MKWLLFSPRGRVSRKPFILAWVLWLLLSGVAISRLVQLPEESGQFTLWSLIFLAITLVSAWSFVVMSIKRLRDIGWPVILVICIFIPALSIIAFIVLSVWPTQMHPPAANANRRGKS